MTKLQRRRHRNTPWLMGVVAQPLCWWAALFLSTSAAGVGGLVRPAVVEAVGVISLDNVPCVNYEAAQSAYEQAKAKWDALNPACYDFEYSFRGFQIGLPKFLKVQVRNGQVDIANSDGQYDMLHFFDMINTLCFPNCPTEGAHSCRNIFDDTVGYPTTVLIDIDQWARDEERAYQIQNFVLRDCNDAASSVNQVDGDGSNLVDGGDADNTASGGDDTDADTSTNSGGAADENTDATPGADATGTTEGAGQNTDPSSGGDDNTATNDKEDSTGTTEGGDTTDNQGDSTSTSATPEGGETDASSGGESPSDTTPAEGVGGNTDATSDGDDAETVEGAPQGDDPAVPGETRCADYEVIVADLQRALKLWSNPKCYNYVYEHGVAAAATNGVSTASLSSPSSGPVKVKVRNGVAMDDEMSINEVMDMIQQDCLDKCKEDGSDMNYKCDIDYDDEMGFPTSIDMDPMDDTAASATSVTTSKMNNVRISHVDVVQCEEAAGGDPTVGADVPPNNNDGTTTLPQEDPPVSSEGSSGDRQKDPSPPVVDDDKEDESSSANENQNNNGGGSTAAGALTNKGSSGGAGAFVSVYGSTIAAAGAAIMSVMLLV